MSYITFILEHEIVTTIYMQTYKNHNREFNSKTQAVACIVITCCFSGLEVTRINFLQSPGHSSGSLHHKSSVDTHERIGFLCESSCFSEWHSNRGRSRNLRASASFCLLREETRFVQFPGWRYQDVSFLPSRFCRIRRERERIMAIPP